MTSPFINDAPIPHAPVQETTQPGQLPIPMGVVPNTGISSNSQNLAVPLAAEDKDLIEPEWVNAVKKIMQDNSTDPYTECRDFVLLKSHYMKKRYGRDIKLSE